MDEQISGCSIEKQRKHQTYLLTLNTVNGGRMNRFLLRGLTEKPYFSGEGLMYGKINTGGDLFIMKSARGLTGNAFFLVEV